MMLTITLISMCGILQVTFYHPMIPLTVSCSRTLKMSYMCTEGYCSWVPRSGNPTIPHSPTQSFCLLQRQDSGLCPLHTLIRIFFLSCVGEGNSSALMSTGLVSSMSPKTFLKWEAMFLCWTMLQ